jgi:site-specific DNA-cytosine methylase
MNVLSLFDGMSCGRIALDRAGIEVGNYYASELDKYAIKVTQANWPDTMQLGDVTKWREWGIEWSSIDLLIGGSPCQGFSFAGKQLAFDDPRSKLFFVYVDILNHIRSVNPNVKFMLENVRMKKEYLDVISDQLGVDPVFINSALVSAQNRQRFYWANWEFGQPDDKRIALNSILEPGYYCDNRNKAYCIDANYGKGTNFRRYYFCGSRQLVLENGYTPGGSMVKETANSIMHSEGNRWRKLSIKECERLQTVPEWYTENVDIPKTEKYKVLGNGWTIDVIAHIFKPLAITNNKE